MIRKIGTFAATVALAAAGYTAYATSEKAPSPEAVKLAVAAFDEEGNLKRPERIEDWVFMGASLGMGYNEAVPFDPDTPGNFQTVLMEPNAYAEFERTGVFPDGTMFALLFHGTTTNVSINQNGFVMDEPLGLEIHLKDKVRFPKTGFNFYFFSPDQLLAETRESPNGCTDCHTRDGAYDGTFTQFYPTIRDRVPQKKPKG